MNRLIFISAFLLGGAAVLWMGAGFIGSDPLALTVTTVIGGVYILGILELVRYRQATASLSLALGATGSDNTADPAALDSWIARLDPSLQNAVRVRIESERVGLPAPVVTPYLVGLLIMLGLLGTFVGMVETLHGAVSALQGTTELEAIRNGLAAPIRGLGLAFGTSVAGVAASAMLGLNSTLSRRERMLATRQLDGVIASTFKGYSLAHNRRETYKAMQYQAQALPQVAQNLQALTDQLQRMGDTLSGTLIANQEQFHDSVRGIYRELAGSVDASLRQSLAESGRMAGESMQPVVAQAMTEITAAAREQLEMISSQLSTATEEVKGSIQAGLQAQQEANQSLTEQLSSSRIAFGEIFEGLSKSTITALQDSAQERQAVMEQLGGLAESLNEATGEQREAVQNLVESSAAMLEDVGARAAGSAAEVSSLGEAFGLAVSLYSESNNKLMDNLGRIEESMDNASSRSDEQMAYYVAQAREIIDQSMLSQREILEELRQVGQTGELLPAEAS